MKRTQLLALIVAALSATSAFGAGSNELIGTVERASSKNTAAIAMDIVSDGTIAGFSFRVEVPGLDQGSAQIKGCVVELPKGFTANCNAVADGVMVIASSDVAGVMLPKGIVPVGKIYVSRRPDGDRAVNRVGASPALLEINFSNVEFSNDKGLSQPGSSKVVQN